MTVTVTAAARPLRRRVGPTPWAVLEDMVCDAERDATGRLVAPTSVRRLAANRGLSKDTVARALTRLIDEGFIRREPVARDPGGSFTSGRYVLDEIELALLLESNQPATATVAKASRRRSPKTPAPQATLFDPRGDRSRTVSSAPKTTRLVPPSFTSCPTINARTAPAPSRQPDDPCPSSTLDDALTGLPDGPPKAARSTSTPTTSQGVTHWHPAVPGTFPACRPGCGESGGGSC